MAKRIVILCDGTWNFRTAEHETHVAALTRGLVPDADGETEQRVLYVSGVGTRWAQEGEDGSEPSDLGKAYDKFVGGAFGVGLTRNLKEAYTKLCEAYEIGDEVFVFGYSRGAFTARSLAGLIRSTGIIPAENVERLLDRAIYHYRRRDLKTHPGNPFTFPIRESFSPRIATSKTEAEWRAEQSGGSEPHVFKITYLGVWDTVGALGVPNHLSTLSTALRWAVPFHDTSLSSIVQSARHAVSIDEDRLSYRPTLWDNLGELNLEQIRVGGELKYQERWFPGNHGVLGGGGEIDALSGYPLRWILEGASKAGLKIDQTILQAKLDKLDLRGPLYSTEAKDAMGWLYRRGPRRGVPWIDRISEAAKLRWHFSKVGAPGHPTYEPMSLQHLTRALDNWAEDDPDAPALIDEATD